MKRKKVALVVGASSGIGFDVSRRLAGLGIKVYAVARRIEKLKPLKKFGVQTAYMDVTDEETIQELIREIIHREGRIDIVINNAGYGEYGPIEAVSIKKAKQQFDVNLFGVARVNQCVLPYMRKQKSGRVIIVASSASHVSTLGSGWYGASKHAVKGLSEALRMEVEGFGIKVIQIEPGPIKTEFENNATQALKSQKYIEDYESLIFHYSRFLEKMFKKAPSSYTTVNAIIQASLIKHPKAVYRTTVSARLLPSVRYIMGVGLYSRCVRYVICHTQKNK